MSLLVLSAWAGPVLEDAPLDPLESCIEEAGPVQALGPIGASKRLAFVIGVPCHDSPTVPSLRFSSRDADRVGDHLEAEGFTIHRLTTRVPRADLERALREAARTLPPDGELLVYFSGHGVLRESDGRLERFLVFSDTLLDDVEATGLSLTELERWVATVPAARRTVVQDTCFASPSSGGKGLSTLTGIKALEIPHPPLQPVDLRLYASRFYEVALEEPGLEGSIYTHHWLEARGAGDADLDGDACINLLEAHLAAATATSAARDGYQNPQWAGTARHAGCTGATRAVTIDGDQLQTVAPGTRIDGLGAVSAGSWVHVDRVDTTRRWAVEIGPSPQIRASTSRPAGLIAGEVALRPVRNGGLRIGTRVGLAPAQRVAGVCFRGWEVAGRGSWTGAVGPIRLGPQVEVGWVHRTPTSDCKTAAGPAQQGVAVGAGLRGEVGGPLWYGALEGGGAWVPRRADPPRSPFEPTIGLSAGLRL